jgi:hypothetical protein
MAHWGVAFVGVKNEATKTHFEVYIYLWRIRGGFRMV